MKNTSEKQSSLQSVAPARVKERGRGEEFKQAKSKKELVPIGNIPPPRALESVRISGLTPSSCSYAKSFPVRPNPDVREG